MRKKFSETTAWLIESLHYHNVDWPEREIYLLGEEDAALDEWKRKKLGEEPGVEFSMANRLIKNLRLLDTTNNKPILIHMKTCGGDWHEGMAIYDAISYCKSYVTILNYTHARSMSSIILQAADNRVMMPHSHFMYHHGSYGVYGDWAKVQSIIDWDRKIPDIMLGLYADRMTTTKAGKYHGQSTDKIKKMIQRQLEKKVDVFFTAEETIESGLADSIFDGDWTTLKN
jgi:ATP-dependent protease ClpP protease subunit